MTFFQRLFRDTARVLVNNLLARSAKRKRFFLTAFYITEIYCVVQSSKDVKYCLFSYYVKGGIIKKFVYIKTDILTCGRLAGR